MNLEYIFPSVRKANKSLKNTFEDIYLTRIDLLNNEIKEINKCGFDNFPYNDLGYLKLVLEEYNHICPEGLEEIFEKDKHFLSEETNNLYMKSKKEFCSLFNEGITKFYERWSDVE